VVKHWNRLPRELVDAPSLSVFKSCFDSGLRNMPYLLVSPEVAMQIYNEDHCKSLPTELFVLFCSTLNKNKDFFQGM